MQILWPQYFCYSGISTTAIAVETTKHRQYFWNLVQKNKCFISHRMFPLSCFFIRILCKTTLYPSRKIQWCNFQGTSPWENAAHAKSISRDHISYSHWELRPLRSYKQPWKGKRAKRLKWKCSKFQINASQHPKVVFLLMHNSLYYHLFNTLSLTQAMSVGWQQELTKQKKDLSVCCNLHLPENQEISHD